MSAIFGLYDQNGVAQSSLQAALDACADYGSDGTGIWLDRTIGLGHRLSYFTPESVGETLPYIADGLTITADTRIDNRADLLTALNLADSSLPDSRLILSAYQRWGTACTERLIGDFAFAIWDSRQQMLFCARDHVGARPFYYFAPSPGCFAFASSLDSLLAFPQVPTIIDEDAVGDYLVFPLDAAVRRTFFKGIVKLPFGHQLCVTSEGIQEHRHWEPRRQPLIHFKRSEAYAELVRERVSEAVAYRLRTAFPIGAHISGGLDSSSVAVMADRQLKQQGRGLSMSYSWSPPKSDEYPAQSDKDERDLIERLCRQEGMSIRFPVVTENDQYAYHHLDIARTPPRGRSMELAVLRDASQRGIRTLLSGWGGDEGITFNGRGYFAWLFVTGRWWTLQKFVLGGGFAPKRWAARALNHVAMPLLPDRLYLRFALPRLKRIPPSWIHPDLAARVDTMERMRRWAEGRDRASTFATQAALFNFGHLTSRLEAWTIWGASFGITYSYPLLDRRVLELAYSLPTQDTTTSRTSRLVYRSAMKDILPDEIRNGDKADPAAEERASRLNFAVWTRLAQEAKAGRFDADVPWLDMPRFRAALINVPDTFGVDSIPQFVRITNALYVWKLWQRYRAIKAH